MPICRKCGHDLHVSKFSKAVRNTSGRQSQCKECEREYTRDYNKRRYRHVKHKIAQKTKERRISDPEAASKSDAKKYLRQMEKFPEKIHARKAVQHALKKGVISKGPCRWCGSDKDIEAHHESYLKKDWLNVWWMCKKHHTERHRELRGQK